MTFLRQSIGRPRNRFRADTTVPAFDHRPAGGEPPAGSWRPEPMSDDRPVASTAGRRLRAAALTITAAFTVALPAAAQWDEVAARFDAAFRTGLTDASVPGGAYAIVHDGQILKLGYHGHADSGRARAIDGNTIFRIASLSKGFSGVLAALLARERRVPLDRPVARYAPDFRLHPEPRPLTVEDVLGQRSGFIRNAYDNLLEAGLERAEILPRFNALEPICPPGRCYSYQNNVFSLVEDFIVEVSGSDYADVVEKRLFEPLGMAGASVGFDALTSTPHRARPHAKTRTGWRAIAPRPTYYQVPSAAGINASIVDMAQWAIAMLGHHPDVLPSGVVDDVLTPRIRTERERRKRAWRGLLDDAWYGLGWRIYAVGERTLAGHGGWVAGYRAEISLSREFDIGIVILSNAETRVVGELTRRFWDLALGRESLATAAQEPASTPGSGS